MFLREVHRGFNRVETNKMQIVSYRSRAEWNKIKDDVLSSVPELETSDINLLSKPSSPVHSNSCEAISDDRWKCLETFLWIPSVDVAAQ